MPEIELSAATGLAPGELFVDPTFPTSDAVAMADGDVAWQISWKRPQELREKPVLFENGATARDVVQGGLGDCWFISACIAVAHSDLIWKVIPKNQVLYGDGYNGSLTFRFWRLGRWETVQIDDLLPVNEYNQLVYSRSEDPNEFWVSLLEKAFAKFHGGYANLQKGQRTEGLISLTGFVVQSVNSADLPAEDMFGLLEAEMGRKSLITCCSRAEYRKGLAGDHTYSVTEARRVGTRKGTEVCLVRVRDPWGATPGGEWTGAWHDGDRRWDQIDPKTKEGIEYKDMEDGEFWMDETDFVKYFHQVTFAMETPLLGMKPMEDIQNMHVLQGSWVKGISAGGSQENMDLFATNPQFLLVVKETDNSGYCSVVLELIQEHDRKLYKGLEEIAIFIYEVEDAGRRLSAQELSSRPEFGAPSQHEASSAAVEAMLLPPGAYVLVASTYAPHRQRRFVLRAYSSRRVQLREL